MLDHDDIVVLHDVSWEQYEAILATIGDNPGIRTTYLDGELEIMSPSRTHEHWKTLLARLVETFAEERGIPLNGFGSETFKKKARRAGLEPDECYIVGEEKKVPDLAIEVIHTSGSVDKLEVYRRLGVPEVWFWVEGRLHVYGLASAGAYARSRRSRVLRGLDLRALQRIVASTDRSHQTEAVRAFRRSLERK